MSDFFNESKVIQCMSRRTDFFFFFLLLFFFISEIGICQAVFLSLFLSLSVCLSPCLSPSLVSIFVCSCQCYQSLSSPRQAFFSYHALASTKQTRSVPNTSHSKASLPQLSHATITSLSESLSPSNLFLCPANTNAPHS